MSDNSKFLISVCSAFVVPTLVYAYSQGVTNASIQEVSNKLDGVKVELTVLNNRAYSFNGAIAVNQNDIEKLNQQINKLENKVEKVL